ncbi:hypothetical protein HYALB_00000420 [Hymenoscyphus albidus]|uniref:ubiquitinyl hydrolase 1 n=1 Tax=Hymenoscyphus albidus TaxID=595503 RepID=A0A9N9Q4W3_9HELO|nr:hypothetical protein HYALB_00000420 [Hymenoscyphus albidus]
MLQPQPTAFSPFNLYALPLPPSSSTAFHPSGLANGAPGPGPGPAPPVYRDHNHHHPVFSPAATTNPNTGELNFTNNLNSTHRRPHAHPPPRKIRNRMNDDLAAQEALARDFQPALTLQGPLVGDKKSSLAITEEYARADPIYVAKTAVDAPSMKMYKALPQTYSHFRPVLGDGNCGWRAAGFSYFETYVRTGNQAGLREEITRMTSLNNLITNIGGFEPWVFEDMVEETIGLLKDLADALQSSIQSASNLLMERFNDQGISNAIVYHFRLLASSWLKANPTEYQDFIQEEDGVEGYIKNWLVPVDREIDHLGMTLLIDILLKPVNFAVEIVYLDRSEGTQVNSHIIQVRDANGDPTNAGGPMIHLLYRPSHYDILYKDSQPQALTEALQNTDMQVNRVASFTHHHIVQSTPVASLSSYNDVDVLFSIPGFGLQSNHGFASQYPPPIEQTYTPSPISSISPISPGDSSATTPSSTSLQPCFPQSQPPPVSKLTPPAPPPIMNPSHTNFPLSAVPNVHSHQPLPHRPTLTATHTLPPSEISSPNSAGSSFRPSRYELEADWAHEGPVQFLTSTFKNSHYNTAHYNNPNFQPEEWTPESDEQPPTRKRSS